MTTPKLPSAREILATREGLPSNVYYTFLRLLVAKIAELEARIKVLEP